jgi:RNA recognition motif-containing protein
VQDREAYSQNESHSPYRFDPGRQNHRVYVGNLSWNVDRDQLRQHMSEVGGGLRAGQRSDVGLPVQRGVVCVSLGRWARCCMPR